MPIDFHKLKQDNNIVDVIGRHVGLKKKGSEYYGVCPFHKDHTESLQVNDSKQIFKCFACGEGGDAVDFLIAKGYTYKEAADELSGNHTIVSGETIKNTPKPPKRVDWKPVTPHQTAPKPNFNHYNLEQPSQKWAYHDSQGHVIGYVCRFDLPEGKQVIPMTYCTDGKRYEWRWRGFERPRPLYNLHLLEQHPDKTVIIVEGEKCADAVNANMDTAVAIAWPGGAEAIKHIEWSPIHGRKVILWPDNDTEQRYGEKHPKAGQIKPWYEQPGNSAMLEIASMIQPHCPVTKWLRVPAGPEFPHKWDAADKDWQLGEMRAFVLANLYAVPTIPTEPEPQPEPAPTELPPEPEHEMEDYDNLPPVYDTNVDAGHYFRFLGYQNENGRPVHCFYPSGSKIIVRLTTSQMTKSSLLDLAPLNFWEDMFPMAKGKGFDANAATNWLSQLSQQFGIFSEKNVRGRGAWHDKNRTVVHTGTHLIVNGVHVRLGDLDTKYIYEIGETLGFSCDNKLSVKEANRFMEVVNLLNWEREINSYLLAGWCVVAPICGALKWRPHIWLTGAAGTGKSWVFKHIVRRLLGETSLAVQGETSEAGLRQSLRHDALPVVFDEAEAEDKRSQDRVQQILTLMRSASAEDGGVMAKGSAAGHAITFRIRSCFAFASIGLSVSQQSDRSRVTVLSLKAYGHNDDDQKIKQERWEKLCKVYDEVITDDFVSRLQARTLWMVPTILKNTVTFANAVAAVIGEQRTGDQLGALLAGAYSLHSSKEVTYDEAVEWVKSKDWSEERGLDKTRDEHALFSHLMEQITRVDGTGSVERNIGELILIASDRMYDQAVTTEMASGRLKRVGIKVEHDAIVISNSSDGIKKFLASTPWSKNHNKILMRIEGAHEVKSARFGSGVLTRAVAVPLSLLQD
jgi:putative DNA primase/helicase